MGKFYVVSGRLAEVHRFINVPLRWSEEYPARERRELWIATPEGQEIKLVVHSRQMPARCGHQVEALVCDGALVGLVNGTTGSLVNYLRADPPLVWRRPDTMALTLLLLSGFVAFVMGSAVIPMLTGVGLAIGMPALVLARKASNHQKSVRIDSALDSLLTRRGAHPVLRRVK